MELKIKKLTLNNFKGIKELSIDFKDDVTKINGDNGTGKTTIFDAYSWLLFNKDSLNRADFNIKTLDKDNNPIHNLEHCVEGVFETSDGEISLKKVYKEKWTKKRGSSTEEFTGHTTDYFINSVPMKLKDYNNAIAHLISEENFKLLSNPMYFNNVLDNKARRKMILGLIKDIKDEDIIDTNKELKPLLELLKSHSIEELTIMNKARISDINKRLKELPIKINERADSKKELDFEELKKEKDKLSQRIEKLESQILSNNNSSILTEKKAKVQELEIELANLKLKDNQAYNDNLLKFKEHNNKVNSQINEYSSQHLQLSKDINKINHEISKLDVELVRLREEYIETNKKDFKVEDTCPTCGQKLPDADVEKQRNELKSKLLQSIQEKGEENKKTIGSLYEQLRELEKKDAELMEEYGKVKSSLIEQEPTMVCNPEIKALQAEIEQINKDIEGVNLNDNTELERLKEVATKELKEVEEQLVYETINQDIDKKIEEYEEEQRTLGDEYDKCSYHMYLCELFTKTKVDVISNDINKMFKLVKFKLFETQINGGVTETCEVTVNGVPYSDLNSAMRINAGLDVINTLSEHYEIYTPIFVDNAESINEMIETKSQIIKLTVTNDKKLVIGGRDE